MRIRNHRLGAGILAAATAATALTACSTGLAAEEQPTGTTAATASSSAFGECSAGEPNPAIDLEAAQALVAEYQQPADSIVVSEPLAEPIDTSLTVDFVDNGTTIAALMWEHVSEAAETAGVQITRVQAGNSAQGINTAFSSVVETAPDMVIAAAIDPTFWADQLDALNAAGTTVVTGAITNAEQFGLQDGYGGHGASIENGAVLAAAAITMTCGQATDFVFYNIPEFSFSNVQMESATAAFEEFCGGECTMRSVDIPVAQMSTGGADAVLSDLQAHPETAAFITPADEIQVGLPAKQDLAGIDVPGLGQSSTPPNIEQIANGTQAGGFAVDLRQFMWLLLDQGLRLEQGMEYPEPDWAAVNPQLSTILTQDNAADAAEGYIAVDDYREQFAALWGVEG
jgi:ribose transport system substrate-binding protein